MDYIDNAMCRQVWSIPDLIQTQKAKVEFACRNVLSNKEIQSIQRIILTGCGDSHAAAMATRYVWEELTGITTEVVPAIDLGRFYSMDRLKDTLVIGVSNSGSVARMVEAVQRSSLYGATTLGITSAPDSMFGRNVDRVLPVVVPPFETAPGTRTYLESLLALLLLAIHVGEVRSHYSDEQATTYRDDILCQADKLEKLLPEMDAYIKELAGKWATLEAFDFIGAGPDYATAWFGQAKIFEACGKYAMCINTEEWLHLNFFMRRVNEIGTILVCHGASPASSRAGELIRYATEDMGRPFLLITSGERNPSWSNCSVVSTPETRYFWTGVLTQFTPLCLLAGYMGEVLGEEDGRGCRGPWGFAVDGMDVKTSEIMIR